MSTLDYPATANATLLKISRAKSIDLDFSQELCYHQSSAFLGLLDIIYNLQLFSPVKGAEHFIAPQPNETD